MSYLEIKKKNNESYVYFIKKWSLQGKSFVLRKYIGKANSMTSKELFMIKNMDSLTEEELKLRKPVWEKATEMAYSPELVKNVEKKAIMLNNLAESKNTQQVLRTEFAKEFIYNSNNIEGSKIPRERLVELFEKGITSHKNKNEVIEVENSIKAYDYLENKFSFNLKSIKRLYYILTKEMIMETGKSYPKGFKKETIIVGNSSTSAPENVKKELKELIEWNKKNAKTMYPLERAFEFHARYEGIHPFQDANGRTGRLIMNKIFIQNNYSPIIIYKDNKKAYFSAIKAVLEGNSRKYNQFMLEQTEKTHDQMINTLRKQ